MQSVENVNLWRGRVFCHVDAAVNVRALDGRCMQDIDGLWFPDSLINDSSGWGRVIRQPEDISAMATMTAEAKALARHALATGLRVMIDLPAQRHCASTTAMTGQLTTFKGTHYQWAVDLPESTHHAQSFDQSDQKTQDGRCFDKLHVIRSAGFISPAHLAPTLHATLTRLYKLLGNACPCWVLSGAPDPIGLVTDIGQKDHQFVRLVNAIQLSLKGSVVFRLSDMNGWDGKLKDDFTNIAKLRQELPALRYGKMRLLPMHGNLLMFLREDEHQQVLCVFNLCDRYVRQPLPLHLTKFCLIARSGLDGGRIINKYIDCAPWGALFASICK